MIMKKVFLYLYPIKEFASTFLLSDESLYDTWHILKPMPILNETIDRRYRQKNYQVIFVMFPDKKIYGLDKKEEDKIIYTDTLFLDINAYDERGNEKKNFIPKYPDEDKIIEKLKDVDKLVIGGYHANDCVKKVAEKSLERGIDTLVDLDLTELFFQVYKKEEYFDMENYNPERFKIYTINKFGKDYLEYEKDIFKKEFSSPVYGYSKKLVKKLK